MWTRYLYTAKVRQSQRIFSVRFTGAAAWPLARQMMAELNFVASTYYTFLSHTSFESGIFLFGYGPVYFNIVYYNSKFEC